jgi:CRP/FNR family transcriptional regulator, cyclic AMP receptor protein
MEITTVQFRKHFKSLAARFAATDDIEALLQNCTLSLVPAGTRIIDYGGACSTLYLVWSGLLSASIEDGDVKLMIGNIRPGEWVGEVTLIEPGPATASVTCVEDSYLLAISHDAFNVLRIGRPDAAGALLHALSLNIAERLRATSERVIEQIGNSEYRLQNMPPEEKATAIGLISKLLSMLLGIRGDK